MGVVKGTVYGHFCAGSGLDEVGRTVKELEGMGLQGILDYGSEDAEDGSGCDRNLSGFLEMVEMMSSLPRSAVSYYYYYYLLQKISLRFAWLTDNLANILKVKFPI